MFALTGEQRLLVDSTRRYLAGAAPADPGQYWRQGAELGWTGLLAETGRTERFTDLVLLAREFGRGVGAGPLGPVNVAVAALAGGNDEVLDSLVDGTTTAAWVDGGSDWATGRLTARHSPGAVVLDGTVAPVEGAVGAQYLVISSVDGPTCLVPVGTPGLAVTPMHSLDPGRTYGRVTCEGVRVQPDAVLGRGPDATGLLDLAVLIQLAEMVGAMEWAVDTTTRWCFDRYSFGQPLAAYQAVQHRLADMAMWLEASRAITADATRAFVTDAADRSELVSAGKAYVGRYGPELLQECVQLHGGIGVTAEHDLHRYLRRVAADAATHGSARQHAARVGRIVEQRVSA